MHGLNIEKFYKNEKKFFENHKILLTKIFCCAKIKKTDEVKE